MQERRSPAQNKKPNTKSSGKRQSKARTQQILAVPRETPLFYDTVTVPMRYAVQVVLTNDGSTANVFGVRQGIYINDIYGVYNHQPYGYDQMYGLYRRYKVQNVDIDIRALALTTEPTCAVINIARPGYTDTMTGLTISQAIERPGYHTMWVQNGSGQAPRFRKRLNMHEVLGISQLEFAADVSRYCAIGSTSPVQTATLFLGAAGASTSAGVSFLVEMVYHVTWWERKIQSQS